MRRCNEADRPAMFRIINDAARAYKGIIPGDRWRDPYMSLEELSNEIESGVVFWGLEVDGGLLGVMGIQDRGEVTLIRHAYVLTSARRQGIGTRLLRHLESLTENPILLGTWRDASWAVAFYEKNGYACVSEKEKDLLLKKYWSVPDRQIETSVVMADNKWRDSQKRIQQGC